MAKEEHLAILRKGVRAWNRWRLREDVRPDLSGADLSVPMVPGRTLHGFENVRPVVEFGGINLENTNLEGANLEWVALLNARLVGADLKGANLSESILGDSDLTEADLLGANLRKAELIGARLRNAELGDADLSYSQLSQAVFDQTRVVRTDFTGAQMVSTLFVKVDLSEASGLETVNHLGPSSVGIDTIYESKGNIPDVFLRGAGVPEPFIANMKALVAAMEPIQFYSCFISYSSKDQEFVDRLYADLQQKNVRCWFAPEDLKIGDKFRTKIDEAIRLHDKLLLVLTESSVKSAWVEKEVETAFEKERKQGRVVLFPIRLDDVVMEAEEAWAADIRRTRHIGDFCGWKEHDKYKRAFDRLIRDLKAEDKGEKQKIEN
jgi:hypothetical protein